MFSLGTEFFFALVMASNSVGLPPGSPPPTRAATSTFLINRAKSLPRRASTTAFLCLVVAHFEWPDIGLGLLHDVEEQAMHTQVAGELGVEGRSEQRPLPD